MNPVLGFELNLPITVFKEDDGFVSYCPLLDVSSQGDTQEEAKENLAEAVTGFMISCYEMGTLSNVLKECGFVPVSQGEMNFAEPDSDFIHIPLPFMLPKGKKNAPYCSDSMEKA
ncbi:MAG: type II toxin-antitoxin system HicB family antitoxin [Desulfococcaceae bacterium]